MIKIIRADRGADPLIRIACHASHIAA